MKINHSEYTVSEILEMFKRKELLINRAYQRGAGVWPNSAKSYFIDTILEGFPFPKVYIYQSFDHNTRKPIKEVVDGQQRLSTIEEFVNNRFRLSSVSEHYAGVYFDELTKEKQAEFMMYTVPADVILAAERSELLEMFRRINSYTAPLNAAEKRHSNFNGDLKWIINDLADRYSPILAAFGVLTEKQIVRMGDAELLAEFIEALDQGIVNKSAASLNTLYRRYDDELPAGNKFELVVRDFFAHLQTVFEPLRDTFMMKPYAFHSLFCAFAHLKYGLPEGKVKIGVPTVGLTLQIPLQAVANLRALAEAHETQDIEGPYSEYVKACLSTTTKIAQRKTRTAAIAREILRR